MMPLKIFIGYDPNEVAAYHVLCHSILRHASGPVAITPLVQAQLREKGLYYRERNKMESTEFSFTRFLVPALSQFGDYSIFMDCDMLCRGDVYELIKIARDDELRAVWCVKHDYCPMNSTKFLGQKQTIYPRKNWSSVMVFRNKFCERLTPAYVNGASGLDLHRMVWAGADQNIGDLPKEWNYLVGEANQTDKPPKLIHYTEGGPWFREYQFCEYAKEWFAECDLAFPSLNLPKPKYVEA